MEINKGTLLEQIEALEKIIQLKNEQIYILANRNEKFKECILELIEATEYGVNQWQEAWLPDEETNAQKVIKKARQTLKELEK